MVFRGQTALILYNTGKVAGNAVLVYSLRPLPVPVGDFVFGEMAEWFKVHAWKACVRLKPYRGFESLSLRHFKKRTVNGTKAPRWIEPLFSIR